jgi:hypothetical protein
MLKPWQFNLLTALASLAVLLMAVNAVLITLNRESQLQLSQRQQFIQQTVPLESLYRDIVKALAEMAIKSSDHQVLNMLAAQGLSVTVNPPAATSNEAVPVQP